MSIVYLSKQRNDHVLRSHNTPSSHRASRAGECDTFYNRQESLETLPSLSVALQPIDTSQDIYRNPTNHYEYLCKKSPFQYHSHSTVSQISSIDDSISIHETNERLYKLVRALDLRGIYEPSWTYLWSWFMGIIGFCDFLSWLLSDLSSKKENLPSQQQKRKRNPVLKFALFWKRHSQQHRNLMPAISQNHLLPHFMKEIDLILQWFTLRQVVFTWIFSIVWVIEGLRIAYRTHHRMKSEYLLGMTLMRRDVKLISTTLFDIELHLPLLAGTWTFFAYLSMVPVEFFLLKWNDTKSMLFLRADIKPYFETASYYYCFFYVVYLDVSTGFIRTIAEAKSAYLFTLYRKLTVHTVNLAVQDPSSLKNRIYFFLRLVRWAKYLAPVIGTTNMLLDSAVDLKRKWKQFKDARIAQKIVNQHWKILTVKGKQERAAIAIQKLYRSYLCKVRRSESIKMLAVKRIQSAMRHKLRRTRKRLDTNMERLQKVKANRIKNNPVEHWIQIKELKDDLKSTCDAKISRKMLLRPNTNFIIMWKILFVISVSIEITFLSLKPYIERNVLSTMHEPITIENAVSTILIPNALYSSKLCRYSTEDASENTLIKGKTKHQRLPTVPKKEPLKPFFCHEPWPFLQIVYVKLMSFIIHETDKLISTICFCDIFVTFFTGEIDEATGVLKPKSFFTRWIFPGLMLQLLVNPKMADAALCIKRLSIHVHRIGPSRVIRWSIAFILPMFSHLRSWAFWNLWMRFVSQQNLYYV